MLGVYYSLENRGNGVAVFPCWVKEHIEGRLVVGGSRIVASTGKATGIDNGGFCCYEVLAMAGAWHHLNATRIACGHRARKQEKNHEETER